jgi:hypothetical protein
MEQGIEKGELALLRHALATLAYRARKTLSGAGDEFWGFGASAETRTPVEILAHMGDLFDWALTLCEGRHVWRDSAPLQGAAEVDRFFALLERFDARLASDTPLACPPEALFRGPVADALTHTGQIALLRRMAGSPVRGENYFKAEIRTGRVGRDQAAPVKEFD